MANTFSTLLTFNKTSHPFNGVDMTLASKISSLLGQHGYANDFHTWEGPAGDSAAPGTGGWICTSVDTGGDAGEVVDVKDSTTYGALRILTNDADNDNTQIQMNGSALKYVAGKQMWFFARIAPQDANDGEIGIGLILETDTDMVNTFPDDGIFFEKTETATELDFHVRKDGTSSESTAVTGTLADDTFRIVGFHVQTDGSIDVYDGTDVDALVNVATVASTNANLPDDEDLTVAIQVQTGTTATRYLDIDWLLVAQER